jgi:hypothetical protein
LVQDNRADQAREELGRRGEDDQDELDAQQGEVPPLAGFGAAVGAVVQLREVYLAQDKIHAFRTFRLVRAHWQSFST